MPRADFLAPQCASATLLARRAGATGHFDENDRPLAVNAALTSWRPHKNSVNARMRGMAAGPDRACRTGDVLRHGYHPDVADLLTRWTAARGSVTSQIVRSMCQQSHCVADCWHGVRPHHYRQARRHLGQQALGGARPPVAGAQTSRMQRGVFCFVWPGIIRPGGHCGGLPAGVTGQPQETDIADA
jgi:hypothetical protein